MITLKKNGYVVDEYIPSYCGESIVIAIDSSKSNTAIIVGDTLGGVLDDYEISGAGESTDVYDLCAFTRKQLKYLFSDANIQLVGIENIITKKSDNYHGLEIHKSRYKITAVFDNFIFTFQEFFGIMPTLIDNWSWKSNVLPEEYRTRQHKKGSKDWLRAINNNFGERSNDITDALCIYIYMMKTYNIIQNYKIKSTVPTDKEFTWYILPDNVTVQHDIEFIVQNEDSFDHNLSTVAEHLSPGQLGLFKWPIDKLSLSTIYSDKLQLYGKAKYTRIDTQVSVLVGVRNE